MQDQRSPVAGFSDDRIDSAVLALLLDCDRPWSDEEVGREVGDRIATVDALGRLCRAGLVHRLGGFVFATRPAVCATRLAL